MNRPRLGLLTALLLLLPALRAAAAPMVVELDASEAPRRIYHTHQTIPAKPGPMTLVYPKWLPGTHSISGPINSIAGLRVSAGGKAIQWRRDEEDLYAFHVEVPGGADSIDVRFDFLGAPSNDWTSWYTNASTEKLAVLSWNCFVLYPKGQKVADIRCAAKLRLPAGWWQGSALTLSKESQGTFEFVECSLDTLVDSPVLSGVHFKTVPITPGDEELQHFVHMAADSAAALEVKAETVAAWKQLVAESDALFGARHYGQYHFLVTLSDAAAGGGLEHHESSDNRMPERALVDDGARDASAGILPHEMVHSWCGKYRRPAGMVRDDFQQPIKADLLWVYEGLTSYLGEVLTARSGLVSVEKSRDGLALNAAAMESVRGRSWRPLSDTAVAAPDLFGAPAQWASWRRGVDFYGEGVLIWLEADTIIRQASGGKRSLDDFCKAFFGGAGGKPEVKPYTMEDIVSALKGVADHDWDGFFKQRLNATGEHAPLGGIEHGGWKLGYGSEPNSMQSASDAAGKSVELAYSVGLRLGADGVISDVIPEMPAAKAGLAPAMKIMAVNGRKYSAELLKQAIKDTKVEAEAKAPPLELLIENGEFIKPYRVEYRGGERYPRLERNEAVPDLLTAILTARTAAPTTKPTTQPAKPGVAQSPIKYLPGKAYHVMPGTHNQESGYFSLCEGLDGRMYIGAAKYGENAYLLEFDPKTEQQRIVIDTNKVCGLTARRYAAQAKLHTRNFVGPSGKIYVGSKQGYRFEKDDTSEYPGGYVMTYDPRTGTAENLGMPMKGQGVIDVVADEARGLLYIVTCEEQHWMVGDIKGNKYTELGPIIAKYGATLMNGEGKACAITKDYELTQYDPDTKKVTTRPIEVDGKRWDPKREDASIPTWVLTADRKRAYVILMSDPTLIEIDLSGGGDVVKAKSYGRMLEGKEPDSRCALCLSPDGRLYAVVRIKNDTGFGTGFLHHLTRFDPKTGKMEDLGVLTVQNPDYFDFEHGPDGKKPPNSNNMHRLPDGTLTPMYHHMAMTVAHDGTVYVSIIAPFTLLRLEQFKMAQAEATPASRALDRALAACDASEAKLPEMTKVAETVAGRYEQGGLVGFVTPYQAITLELWGRSGGLMHIGFDRCWKNEKERTEAEKAKDVLLVAYDRPPGEKDLAEIQKHKARGCYIIGMGPRNAPEVQEYAALCDVWLDSGNATGKFDRIDTLANALNGWVLTGEMVGALTRRGKMPPVWKSFAYPDSREWVERYFEKKQFHDDYKVSPVAARQIGGAFIDRIRSHLRRLRETQVGNIRDAAKLIADESAAGRKTVVAWQGHMPWTYVGKFEDKSWARAVELHPFLKSQCEEYVKNTPDGALVLSLGDQGLDPRGVEVWKQKRQRVIHASGHHVDPAFAPGPGLLKWIDLGYAYGDACVNIDGYPARFGAPSGIMQLAAYAGIDAEVQAWRQK